MLESPSYRALLRLPGFRLLVAGTLSARTAQQMLAVALVLFVLRDYRSPGLAGLATFLWVFPGLVVSPIAGALLDRYGRVRLIVLDYTVQALALGLLGILALLHLLPAAVLLLIVSLASLTTVLSLTGGRSLFALLVPEHLWERANAFDSQGYLIATLIGPPLAGLLVGTLGGPWTLIACTVLVGLGAAAIRRIRDPLATSAEGSLLQNALAGLRYVAGSASLRGLAIALTVLNLGFGALVVAEPVLILNRLHQAPVVVGLVYSVTGAAGLATGLWAGRLNTRGRERQILAVCFLVHAAGLSLLPWARSIWPVLVMSAVIGVAMGPADVTFFTLRQRRTDPAWYGRVFAVSMSLNYVGTPLGSALAGPLLAWSLTGTLLVISGCALAASTLPMILIPREEPIRRPG